METLNNRVFDNNGNLLENIHEEYEELIGFLQKSLDHEPRHNKTFTQHINPLRSNLKGHIRCSCGKMIKNCKFKCRIK